MYIRVKVARAEKQQQQKKISKYQGKAMAASHSRRGKPCPVDELIFLLTAWERMDGKRKIFFSYS